MNKTAYISNKTKALHRRLQVRWILLLMPPLLFLITFYIYPIFRMLILSFYDPEFTLNHYKHFFNVPTYYKVLFETFKMGLSVTLICLILGYPVSYILSNSSARVRSLLMIMVVLPFFTAILVRTYAWMVILGRNGLVNQILIQLGLISSPLKLIHNIVGVYVGMVHILLPFMILPLYSVMIGINKGFMKAAENLGANPLRVFLHIFFPLSLPGVGGGCILVFIIAIGFYITPALLGGVSDIMISNLIEVEINQLLNWGFAAAIAVVLLVITLLLLLIHTRYFGMDKIMRH